MTWTGILMPRGVPQPVMAKLREAMLKIHHRSRLCRAPGAGRLGDRALLSRRDAPDHGRRDRALSRDDEGRRHRAGVTAPPGLPGPPYRCIQNDTTIWPHPDGHHHGRRSPPGPRQPGAAQNLRDLSQAGDEGLTVGSVQDLVGINASTLSHHLKTLVLAGLVTQTRAATSLVCRPNHDVMDGLFSYLARECRPAPKRKAA